jgi:chemotaxis signal transduction protein
MMPAQDLFPWQNEVAGLMGFTHVHGERLPVFDLMPRLDCRGSRQMQITAQTRMIIAEVHGVRAGFLVDRLTDMIHARAHEIKKETIYGHGRPKQIVILDELWPRTELAGLAA